MKKAKIKLRLRVYVGKKDIEHGKRGKCTECPITLAVYRALLRVPGVRPSHVGTGTARVSIRGRGLKGTRVPGLPWYANLPRKAQRFVRRFDSAYFCKPISFRLSFVQI